MDELKILKNELQHLISGKSKPGESNTIKAAQTYLRNFKETGGEAEGEKYDRTKEERALIEFALTHHLIIDDATIGTYITEGAEQKIYFKEGNDKVFKKADAIFYVSWLDYLNNLLLHNYFFSDTSYVLVGFIVQEEKLYAILEQPFVYSTTVTALEKVKEFLLLKGFIHKKNNDYYHPYLGIILEDLHDENVITNDDMLFFIDTVFYLDKQFFQP